MNKSWKTTLVGCLLAAAIAVKPILDSSGYHFDAKTVGTLAFAAGFAVLGILSKDADVTGK